MNFEDLKNISSPIETENKSEKQEILFEKIEQISLVYADKNFQEIKKNNEDYKFSEAIKDFSPIENIILRPVFHLDEFNFKKYQEKIDLFLEDFYNEADTAYKERGFDLDNILNLVNLKKDSIKKYLEVEDFREFERNTKEADTKILNFNKITNIEEDAEKKYKDLEKIGFSKSDHFIEVHMEDFYSTGEKNLGSELIKNDLGAVAEYIIDKEPEVVAILGKSWLLDTPVANRLGFKKIEDETSKQNDFSTWLQFIDKNGQIDQKRFGQFLKTGEIPYKSTKAYIPTEEFLKRYLPENRKGKIILKEIKPDKKDFWFKLQNESQSIKSEWDNLLKNGDDFDNFVEKNESLNEVLNFVTPEDKEEYIRFLKTMYNNDITWAEFYKHKGGNIEKIDENINKAMKNDLYKDKEVFIE
jgi:hypothetical protein